MGLTMEFYSALPQEFKALYISKDQDYEAFFEKLESYSMADFSFHLLYPDDLDRLCQILRECGFDVLPLFRLLIRDETWNEQTNELIAVLDQNITVVLAGLHEKEIEYVAREWSNSFNDSIPVDETPTYQALIQLRKVAQDVIAFKKSLIFYLQA